MVAYLIETTPINKVVEKVKAGRTIPKEEVIQSSEPRLCSVLCSQRALTPSAETVKDLNSDEEIAAGPLGLSLRDPVGSVSLFPVNDC